VITYPHSFLQRLKNPAQFLRVLQSRTVIWPWLVRSYKLLLGTLAYNVFVLVFVQPLLRKWFPPLKPWEHVKGVFGGSTRTTFEELVPVVGTTLWILGNALIFTLLNNSSRDTASTLAEGGAITRLDPRARAGR
jgi:hypothetical protein